MLLRCYLYFPIKSSLFICYLRKLHYICRLNNKYTSQEGNRWICFENATYYPDSYASNAMPSCFCYYETASSIGLFMVGFSNSCSKEGMNCVTLRCRLLGEIRGGVARAYNSLS